MLFWPFLFWRIKYVLLYEFYFWFRENYYMNCYFDYFYFGDQICFIMWILFLGIKYVLLLEFYFCFRKDYNMNCYFDHFYFGGINMFYSVHFIFDFEKTIIWIVILTIIILGYKYVLLYGFYFWFWGTIICMFLYSWLLWHIYYSLYWIIQHIGAPP